MTHSSIIPLAVPYLAGHEARYLQECVETNFVSSVGPFVERFEALVAACSDARHAVSTSSGTSGLHLALAAIGVGHGDLVLMPSYTFIATANAVSHCGAMPWLVDVNPASWTLDPELLRATLVAETRLAGGKLVHVRSGRRIAAIMPVYALGVPADMDPIVAIADEFDLPVVADAAAAHGARYKGRPLAQMGAVLSVLSFNGNKTVTAGGGGCIIGNDDAIMERIKHLARTARVGRGYDHDAVGYNYRMTNLNSAVGLAQLERLNELLEAKRRIRKTYDEAFRNLPGVELFPDPVWVESGCWLSGIVAVQGWASFADAFERAGIEAHPFWKPVHLQSPYAGAPRTAMATSDSIWSKVVILPSSANLTDVDQARVIDAVRGVVV